ncbi:DUF2220 family protein [Sutcliffiella sp. NC1]|nr:MULTISPECIES: Wadjet anti-phage system protein JetD domain-containing protein [Sutcliffiella]WBL16847.1 DUF2220 family protein [Sutcliffiella sp. NC1]
MEEMKKFLNTYSKKTIGLTELEHMFTSSFQSYEQFAKVVLKLEKSAILVMVKSKGRNSRIPSLAFQYRINKSLLVEDFHQELVQYRRRFHSSIILDEYYSKDQSLWKQDLPFIEKIDVYLKQNSFPTDRVPAAERSYEIVGDEKWIDEKGGKELLERIKLFDKLHILPVSDPLMLAVHPSNLSNDIQYHLIVENKTTYQGLVEVLKETDFSTIIYGKGKAVIASIEQFPFQFPIKADHRFLYFGDIDREGISIWYSLNEKRRVELALPFYNACLKKSPAKGKEYQKERLVALESFVNCFETNQQEQIKTLLANGQYYPQESLNTKELQQIWRDYFGQA